MTRSIARLASLTSLLLASHATQAEEALWPLEQNVNISLGVFVMDTDTRVRVDATEIDKGTEIDMEDEFGFDNQSRFRVDGYWRFAARHKLRFMYFTSRADSTRAISRDIQFQDQTFPVNASVRAEFNTDVIELAYEYSFIRKHSFELAASFGLHNLKLSTALSAEASSSLGAGGVDLEAEAKGNGPLPVIGLHALWAFDADFYLDMQAQFFGIKFDEYDGSLQDYKINLVWQPIRNVGIGVGYNSFVTKVDVDAEKFLGSLRFAYGGPLAFVSVAF
jgi:hypothetical protein